MWQKLSLMAIVLTCLALAAHRVWSYAAVPARAHEHAGAGAIISLGEDRFHVEALFTTEGFLKLYTLDRARGVLPVTAQHLTAYVASEGGAEARAVALHPEPQSGDASGTTSCFCGELPPGLVGQPLRLSVPNLRIGGERFHLAFVGDGVDHLPEMPAQMAAAEQRQLYLAPSGKYTLADIEANGRTVPSQRYPNFKARHDANPQPGDRLCPVSHTKANPACRWVIDSKEYQFCCLPCIDELVRLAKQQPEQLQPPDAFIKQ